VRQKTPTLSREGLSVMNVLALDLASVSGFAVGEPGVDATARIDPLRITGRES
jgi:hypothetical protein